VFEALACGIPLVSAPWQDSENLFRPGEDFLVARNGAEMTALLKEVLHDDALAQSLVTSGLNAILTRHTCTHRVDELTHIVAVVRNQRVRQQQDMEAFQ
jgi:spore maturation protein CgeB